MPSCNDPKCPLNRQGVWHDTHEEMERQGITNQCNDPRCAMNRMGMAHNVHDEFYMGMRDLQEITSERHTYPLSGEPIPTKSRPPVGFTMRKEWPDQQKIPEERHAYPLSGEPIPTKSRPPVGPHMRKEWPDQQESKQLARHLQRMKAKRKAEARGQSGNDVGDGDASHALNELLRNISDETRGRQDRPRTNTSGLQDAAARRRAHAGTDERASDERGAVKTSEAESILTAKNPHETLGLSRNATYAQIKSRYRELARMHDPSRGRINKSEHDKERADAVMSKINKAYWNLKNIHRCKW